MKFSKEEIRENVMVPSSVEMELTRLVEEKLNQCGIFYRVFSRIKKASSLERKYNDKEYDNDKNKTTYNVKVFIDSDKDIVPNINSIYIKQIG